MSQQHCHFDASRSLTALEQDSTIIAVIEMSQSKWQRSPNSLYFRRTGLRPTRSNPRCQFCLDCLRIRRGRRTRLQTLPKDDLSDPGHLSGAGPPKRVAYLSFAALIHGNVTFDGSTLQR